VCGLALIAVAVLCSGQTVVQSKTKPDPQNPSQDQPVLGAEDKTEIAETLKLKTEAGDEVWPGLAAADIPVILCGARYEFLVGEAAPSGPWETVSEDDFEGRLYARRAAHDSQYFAVKIGTHYAGSVGILSQMNSKSPFKLSRDFHVVMILHEMFHAFQAERAPERFAAALNVYGSESRYPYKNEEFAAAWNEEGAALAGALKAFDDAETRRLARKFLETRDARRGRTGFDSTIQTYERELEWLEGLAEYAEIRFYELGASRPISASSITFAPQLPFLLQYDFARLEKVLGTQEGDLRFYLSGMAQARLLDRLSPGWKTNAAMGNAYLEDLLRDAIRLPGKDPEK
jgi:hypothetical protein